MRCVIAVRAPELHARAVRVARSCCDMLDFVSDAEELRRVILRRQPGLAIAESCFEAESLLELAGENPGMSWLIFQDALESWGAERHVASSGPRVALISSATSSIDLYCAVRAAASEDDVWFESNRLKGAGAWMESLMAFPGIFVTEDEDDGAQVDWSPFRRRINGRFRPKFPGRFRGVSTLAAMCAVHRGHQSGWLVLERSGCHFGICFWGGLPVDARTDVEALDLFSFAEQSGVIPSGRAIEWRKSGRRACLPDDVCRTWVENAIREFASCGTGTVEFTPVETGFDHAPWFGEADMPQLFEGCAFRMPVLELLDALRMLVPFRIRLDAEKWDFDKLFSREECKAVVERLKKSDRVEELLAYLPHGYPVHQTIYLLLAQGCVDI